MQNTAYNLKYTQFSYKESSFQVQRGFCTII